MVASSFEDYSSEIIMSIWAIADLHLSFGTADKKMDIFGKHWVNHAEKIKKHWLQCVANDDLVLISGDISWAKTLEEAQLDLNWIDALPGQKVMIRGNHDYWWTSYSKLSQSLPPSIHAIQNNAFHWNGISICGTRLWDSSEYDFNEIIDFQDKQADNKKLDAAEEENREKIFARELLRLESSLNMLDSNSNVRIALTHYPPIGYRLESSIVSRMLEKHRVNFCIFGHLHSVQQDCQIFGEKNGVHYILTAADYLKFKPRLIYRK